MFKILDNVLQSSVLNLNTCNCFIKIYYYTFLTNLFYGEIAVYEHSI